MTSSGFVPRTPARMKLAFMDLSRRVLDERGEIRVCPLALTDQSGGDERQPGERLAARRCRTALGRDREGVLEVVDRTVSVAR